MKNRESNRIAEVVFQGRSMPWGESLQCRMVRVRVSQCPTGGWRNHSSRHQKLCIMGLEASTALQYKIYTCKPQAPNTMPIIFWQPLLGFLHPPLPCHSAVWMWWEKPVWEEKQVWGLRIHYVKIQHWVSVYPASSPTVSWRISPALPLTGWGPSLNLYDVCISHSWASLNQNLMALNVNH